MTDFRRPLHDETAPLYVAFSPSADRACFDDEIAIDFPSIGAVVDRMRAGFLGNEAGAAAHQSAISLSPRQAWAGATVPLDVPLRHTCRECSRSHQVRVLVPAGVTDGTRFRFLVAAPHGVPTRIEVTVLVA